ncbi:hypothetical protein [Vibrio coralliilyticus]|uniref:hypothetical protein n=1 Tax=Vibrio coralliilyticus TaxID=190893 RepID=UPI00155FE7E0|nr:hypothetical protein [Vibrio coralliilyticus]NRF13129.1 hypothetical protein [Vibrio coralliilyticus]
MTIDDLVDDVIDYNSGKYEKCMVFMVHCMDLISDKLPEVGEQALDVASKFWTQNMVDSIQLDNAKIQCWEYLKYYSATTNVKEVRFCAMRAVICLLYTDYKDEDADETLAFFFKMLELIYGNEAKLVEDLSLTIKNFKASNI